MDQGKINDVLCVIPARGGSKGIPNKNLRLLNGIPLVAHSILHAKKVLPKENIVVSSDDEKILTVAQEYGATPLLRPDDISGDKSSTEDALIHAYNSNQKPYIWLLQVTSPIRLEPTMKGFIQFCLDNDYDSALTATEFHDFFWYVHKSKWESTYNPAKRPMRQQLAFFDDRFFDNGNMYFTKSQVLLAHNSRLAGNVGVYPITELEGMQIDTVQDLLIFEAVFDGHIDELIGINRGKLPKMQSSS
jgi:N-acylneuraminate cytidylyltransferase